MEQARQKQLESETQQTCMRMEAAELHDPLQEKDKGKNKGKENNKAHEKAERRDNKEWCDDKHRSHLEMSDDKGDRRDRRKYEAWKNKRRDWEREDHHHNHEYSRRDWT